MLVVLVVVLFLYLVLSSRVETYTTAETDKVIDATLILIDQELAHPDGTDYLLPTHENKPYHHWYLTSHIYPNKSTMQFIDTAIDFGTECNLHILDYVSFTRFLHGKDKISCDWCSLCNGALNMLIDACHICIKHDPAKLETPQFKYLTGWVNEFKYDLHLWLLNAPPEPAEHSDIPALQACYKLRHYTETIEQYYCPFKHLRELKYDRSHLVYDSRSLVDIDAAQKILLNGPVNCSSCVTTINAHPTFNIREEYSAFYPYVMYKLKKHQL